SPDPGGAVRMVHERTDHGRRRVPEAGRDQSDDVRGRDQDGNELVHVPLRNAFPDPRGNSDGRQSDGGVRGRSEMTAVPTESHPLSRRTFVKGAGALVVAISVPRLLNPKAAFAAVAGVDPVGIGPASIDPAQIDSWIAIGADGTVTM